MIAVYLDKILADIGHQNEKMRIPIIAFQPSEGEEQNKNSHLTQLSEKLKVDFERMVFLDDSSQNVGEAPPKIRSIAVLYHDDCENYWKDVCTSIKQYYKKKEIAATLNDLRKEPEALTSLFEGADIQKRFLGGYQHIKESDITFTEGMNAVKIKFQPRFVTPGGKSEENITISLQQLEGLKETMIQKEKMKPEQHRL